MAQSKCPHGDNYLTAECDGWENSDDPLRVRITCTNCSSHVDIRVDDPAELDWVKP